MDQRSDLPPYAPDIWTEQDIVALADAKTSEDQHLEFKGVASLGSTEKERTELSCDVSSLANADGGTIIYGICEDNQHRASTVEGLEASAFDRDSLYRILNSRIQPPIRNLRITTIRLSGANEGKVAVAIDVPKAVRDAPHQAYDRRYYRRLRIEKKALDHSGVLDLLRRADAPDLRVWLQSGDITELPDDFVQRNDLVVAAAELMIANESAALCMYALVDIMIDGRLTFWGVPSEWDAHETRYSDNFLFEGNRYRVCFNTFQRKWNGNAPAMVPMFQGSSFYLAAKTCGFGFAGGLERVPHFIGWRCRAPEMNETRGYIAFWLENGKLRMVTFPWQ